MKKILLICLFVLLAMPALAHAQIVTLYVSPGGSDESPGTEAAPLQTLQAALSRLRENKEVQEATVILRGGIYRLEETLRLDRNDRASITFAAYPGEEAVITGDLSVAGWANALWQEEEVWATPLEGPILRALYGGDGARQNARWPKEGYLNVSAPPYETSSLFENHGAFFANSDTLPGSLDGAFVRMLHLWKDELSPVRGYDSGSGRISLARPTSLSVRANDRFWLENVLSAPLAPGEWAHDTAEGILYYAPLPGETPDNTPLYTGALAQLVRIEGTSDITFKGITFARTAWSIPTGTDFAQAAYDAVSAVYVRNAKNIDFSACTFRDIGGGCIRLDKNVKDTIVRDCSFLNIGAQAVFVHGENLSGNPDATERIVIDNNHIQGYGRNFLNAAAVLLIHTRHVDVTHNEIHDGTYTAVSVGWVWGTGYNVTDHINVANNLIHDIGHEVLADMGGVYTLGVQKNTVISGNVIHDVRAAEYGGWGVYLDEGASGITVENNLIYSCSSQGFHQHNGVNNTVRNNIFAYSEEGQIGASDKRYTGTFLLDSNLLVGQEPYFWRKYTNEKINEGRNLYYTGKSPFAALDGARFTLIDDPAFELIGFEIWENIAGRRVQ